MHFLKRISCGLSLGAFGLIGAASASGSGPGMTAEASLKDILIGNEVYKKNEMLAKRRSETAQSQSPQAIIVSCSDSRVPPEGVFNRYVGRLFVVRTAGHAVGDYELASIEYAVEHLHVPLIVVMGHERCGAVKATADAFGGGAAPAHADSHDDHGAKPAKSNKHVDHGAHGGDHDAKPAKPAKAAKPAKSDKHDDHGGHGGHHRRTDEHGALASDAAEGACAGPAKAGSAPPHDHIGALVKELTPAVAEAKQGNPDDLVDAAVRANAKRVARQLVSESGVLRDAVETGKLKVVAARYDLDTGAVDLLE
jgi:carbonic anhydrase